MVNDVWQLDLHGDRGCPTRDIEIVAETQRETIAWGSQPNMPCLGGNNLSRQYPDSTFWENRNNQMLAFRNVSENDPQGRRNERCRADVHYCSNSNASSFWNLWALDGQ